MKNKKMRLLLLAFTLVLLVQVACLAPEYYYCIITGGDWVKESWEDIPWCDHGSTIPESISPIATNTPPIPESFECVAPANSYTWQYEDLHQQSGTGGTACNARLVFTSFSDKPLGLIVYTAWDNVSMQYEGWKTYHIEPGATWEERVSHVNYTDGTVTYSRVERLLVIMDVPACAHLFSDDNEPMWTVEALTIEMIPCP